MSGDLTGDDLVGVSDALLILSEFGCQLPAKPTWMAMASSPYPTFCFF